jgi:hypothetical protein
VGGVELNLGIEHPSRTTGRVGTAVASAMLGGGTAGGSLAGPKRLSPSSPLNIGPPLPMSPGWTVAPWRGCSGMNGDQPHWSTARRILVVSGCNVNLLLTPTYYGAGELLRGGIRSSNRFRRASYILPLAEAGRILTDGLTAFFSE